MANPKRFQHLGPWLASCCTLVWTGCYFGAIELETVNEAPRIFQATGCIPDATCDDTLVLEAEVTPVWVMVEDDGPWEELDFYWFVAGLPDASARTEPYEDMAFSRLDLVRDPALDGETVTCRVQDAGGLEVSITWFLEVP